MDKETEKTTNEDMKNIEVNSNDEDVPNRREGVGLQSVDTKSKRATNRDCINAVLADIGVEHPEFGPPKLITTPVKLPL